MWSPNGLASLCRGDENRWQRKPKALPESSSVPRSRNGRQQQSCSNGVGWKPRKNPATGEVFFLDSFYRTNQALTEASDFASMSIMNRRAFLAIGTALLGLLPMVSADSYAQQSGASDTTVSRQAPTIEGRWVLTYDNPAGVHKTRIYTFDRDKNGRLTGTENEPGCQCDLTVFFKGDKLSMKVSVAFAPSGRSVGS